MSLDTGTSKQGFLSLDPPTGPFRCHQRRLPETEKGVLEIEVSFESSSPAVPRRTHLTWYESLREIHHKWTPRSGGNRHLDFQDTQPQHFYSRADCSAPVVCLYKLNGDNTVLFALSDAMHECRLSIQVTKDERLLCGITLFEEDWDAISNYSVILRIDYRHLSMQKCLQECARWWEKSIPGGLGDIPEGATGPRYNLRGHLNSFSLPDIDRRGSLASNLGIETFSFGAGWPEISCIDPDPSALEDLKSYSTCLKEKGLKTLVRIQPDKPNPFEISLQNNTLIGARDALGELIDPNNSLLDFRYPEMRAKAINACTHLLKYCLLDGLIFCFPEPQGKQASNLSDDPSQDFHSTTEALSKFFIDLRTALRNVHPDVLIEIQQPTTSPHMLKFANMARAAYCGNSFAENRLRILDIRMLSGRAAPHSSPMIWSRSERVESVATQLTHTLFAVPQVSENLDALSHEHLRMLRWHLSFWSEHQDVILHGELNALEPYNGYPQVIATNKDKVLVAVYSNSVIQLPRDIPKTILLVNGTFRDHIVLDYEKNSEPYLMEVRSCTGELQNQYTFDLKAGLNRINVPINGYITLKEQAHEHKET